MMQNHEANILIIRLSAMGDVAISAPLVKAYASANPSCNFYMVSQPRFEAMFTCNAINNKTHLTQQPDNLYYIPLNTKRGSKDYCGTIFKVISFALKVKKEYGITHLADIHDVLRTKILRFTLFMAGVKVIKIDKHRKQRRELCREKNKKLKQIIKSQRCMEEVFVKLGFNDLHFAESNNTKETISKKTDGKNREFFSIGIAPFAKHKGKEWSTKKMEEVIKYFSSKGDKGGVYYKIFLYGGGKRELEIMQPWSTNYPNVKLFAGKHSLQEELHSMSKLDLMVSMDSANMHLASLVGTPVISIWGATHPYAGYNGWGQDLNNVIQRELPCRPCSVFGAKPCFREDYACLNSITAKEVIDKIDSFLNKC